MDRELERKMMAGSLGGVSKQAEAPRDFAYDQATTAGPRPLRRSPVRERIYEALAQSQRANQRAEAAQRALSIIDAHPEFADLLDALEQF